MPKKQTIEKIAEAPAAALEKAVNVGAEAASDVFGKRPVSRASRFWHLLGPGLTTGASDDDPAGVATYSQTGALYGFGMLWLAWITFPLMSIVQLMCGRLGLVTGRGLAGNIREHYPRAVLIVCTTLLFGANVFNLGADLGAMAEATQLLLPGWSFWILLVIFTAICLLLMVYAGYDRVAKYFKYLALILLLYIVSALSISGLDWSNIIKQSLVPHIVWDKQYLIILCAVIGTTLSPYLFFWQTSQEVEERRLLGKVRVKSRHDLVKIRDLKNLRVDVWMGMFLSNIVMFFIIVAAGGTLHASGVMINSASEAAVALKPFAGQAAFVLFALGIIGTGMLAVPVLAGSAAYALSESFHWKFGLYRKLQDAHAFYGVIIIAMIIGMLINIIGISPMKSLIYSAVFNGVVAPVVLFFVIQLSSDPVVMGHRANPRWLKWVGYSIVALLSAVGVATVWTL